MASDIIPDRIAAELKEPRRQELIDRLNCARGGAADSSQEVWAAPWLCSIEKLEEYVEHIEKSLSSLAATSLYTTAVSTDIIKPCMFSLFLRN
jgi:hypothetical protein